VTFHCEGNTVVVEQPTLQHFQRLDGSDVYVPGYSVRIPRASVADGAIDLYATTEATATMAARVIGPMRVYLKAVPDAVIEVGPNQPTVAGVSYPNFPAAMAWVAGQPDVLHAELKAVENFTWNINTNGFGN